MNRYLVAATLGILGLAAVAGTTFAVSPPAPVPPVSPRRRERRRRSGRCRWRTSSPASYLERADVVLTRRDWDLASWLIRWSTSSPFSHAAMVFTGPQFESGFSNTFVIEAGTGGVDLTDLRDYIADKSTFLAIKRVKRPWFDETKQSRVRGVLLDKIKATYDYWAVGHLARTLWFGVERTVRGEQADDRELPGPAMEPPNEFICSASCSSASSRRSWSTSSPVSSRARSLNQVVFDKEALSRLPQTDEDWSYLTPGGGQGRRRHILQSAEFGDQLGDAGGSCRERQARVAVLHQERAASTRSRRTTRCASSSARVAGAGLRAERRAARFASWAALALGATFTAAADARSLMRCRTLPGRPMHPAMQTTSLSSSSSWCAGSAPAAAARRPLGPSCRAWHVLGRTARDGLWQELHDPCLAVAAGNADHHELVGVGGQDRLHARIVGRHAASGAADRQRRRLHRPSPRRLQYAGATAAAVAKARSAMKPCWSGRGDAKAKASRARPDPGSQCRSIRAHSPRGPRMREPSIQRVSQVMVNESLRLPYGPERPS